MTFFLFPVFSNLYKQMKLMSIGEGGIALPPLPREELLPGIQDSPGKDEWDISPNTNSRLYGNTPVFPTIAFLGMALVLVFLVNILYKNKSKPRRKKTRRRFTNVTFGVKVPGV